MALAAASMGSAEEHHNGDFHYFAIFIIYLFCRTGLLLGGRWAPASKGRGEKKRRAPEFPEFPRRGNVREVQANQGQGKDK